MKEIKNLDMQIRDKTNCSCLFFIDENEYEFKLKNKIYKKENVKLLFDEEKVYIFKEDKKHTILTKELYEEAKKIIETWYWKIEEIWMTEEKNNPIVFVTKPMAIMIASRVDSEDLK